jgi:hypothetical protein
VAAALLQQVLMAAHQMLEQMAVMELRLRSQAQALHAQAVALADKLLEALAVLVAAVMVEIVVLMAVTEQSIQALAVEVTEKRQAWEVTAQAVLV